MKPEPIVTDRLTLRPPLASDAEGVFEGYAQDAEVTRYLVWRPHGSIEDTRRFLDRCRTGWDSGGEYTWTMTVRGSATAVGMVACRPTGHKADIGYVLARQYWNRGYMTEAVKAVVGWAFNLPGMFRVWAVCDVENLASARVLEKSGMAREGVLRRWSILPNISYEPRDCFVYAAVR